MFNKIASSLAAASLGVALLTGCSDNAAETPPQSSSVTADASGQFVDADIEFAQMMYPHHAQAVEMAELANDRTDNPDVLSLANAIAAAQQPEMEQLTQWLVEWGQPEPNAGMADMDGMDHGSGSGMMTTQDMQSLQAASGPDFDRQWLTMMIDHHTGAIEMADTEIAEGSNTQAISMARTIVDTQRQEIETMQRLLG